MTDTIDAAAALAGSAILPQGTPGLTGAAPPPAGGQVDARGTTFDPALHEVDPAGQPRRRVNGEWQRKRGNGARAAAGKPPVGAVRGFRPAGAPAPGPAPQPPPRADPRAQFPGLDQVVPDVPPPAGGTIHDAQPAPEAGPRSLEDYSATAQALTHGQFSALRLVFGDAWEASKDEHDRWAEAWRRLLHHYQLPVVGPIIEWLVLAVVTVAKRASDAQTRLRTMAIWRWLNGGKFSTPPPKVAAPEDRS